MKNKLREKMANRQKTVGAFSVFGSTAVMECLGLAGLDFVIIDTEHGALDAETAVPLILAAERRGITPIVRVQDASRSSVLKMLDIGAMGLLVPFIKTVSEVENVIEYAKYMPLGQRGFGPGRQSGFGMLPGFGSIAEYFDTCNRETLVIPQCETPEAVDCIEDIAALDGVDGIFVGPYDLSIAMGKAMQFTDPEFTQAVQRALSACKKAGKFCLTLAADPATAKANFELGFDGVASADISFLVSAAIGFVSGCRQ
ncbi:MAG: aldolase/citrate lyase family protein [Desulfobacterales bacterium]